MRASKFAWLDFAACKDKPTVWWYPVPRIGRLDPKHLYDKALPICEACPVRQICLDWALRHREVEGMWGATTEAERRRIHRQSLKDRKAAAS